MKALVRVTGGAWLSAAMLLNVGSVTAQAAEDCGGLFIINARIVDGSGAPARTGRLHVRDGVIRAVGDVPVCAGAEIISAGGLVLAPGFIDTHSHHDSDLSQDSSLLAAVSQGITTVVVGQDGGSQLPLTGLAALLQAQPASINVASYTGHNSLRSRVLGPDYERPATATEVARMQSLLAADLEAGSLGLATGLEYDPGIYSSTAEVIALARTVAAAGGRYISHIRSEDRALLEALDELIEIGATARLPVQVSHIKLARVGLWGRAAEVLKRLDAARARGIDVTADLYPYTYWQSTLTVLLPRRDFSDLAAARYALEELAPADGLILTRYQPDPSLVGKSIAEIATLRELTPEATYLALIRAAYPPQIDSVGGDQDARESVIGRSMTDADIATLAAWPHTNFCSDGSAASGHPRGWGAFPRVLRRLVRETGRLTLEQAVHKMTGLAAAHVGLRDRGQLIVGQAADFILFDPDEIGDRASIQAPALPSAGIAGVWVAGEPVFANGAATAVRPGRFLRRPGS